MKIDNYNNIIKVLEELKKSHPNHNLGKHLATAFDEMNSVWGVSDKELYTALKKYQSGLSMDHYHDDTELEKIIKDGLDLNDTLYDDEEFI